MNLISLLSYVRSETKGEKGSRHSRMTGTLWPQLFHRKVKQR